MIEVILDWCKGCEICVKRCPVNALELSDELNIDQEVRAKLHPRLQADPETAKRLGRIIEEHGRLLPKHYWDLEFVANWTGGTIGMRRPCRQRSTGSIP